MLAGLLPGVSASAFRVPAGLLPGWCFSGEVVSWRKVGVEPDPLTHQLSHPREAEENANTGSWAEARGFGRWVASSKSDYDRL